MVRGAPFFAYKALHNKDTLSIPYYLVRYMLYTLILEPRHEICHVVLRLAWLPYLHLQARVRGALPSAAVEVNKPLLFRGIPPAASYLVYALFMVLRRFSGWGFTI